MDSLFSFPVGLFHPLQHAGLSRRTTSGGQSARNPLSTLPISPFGGRLRMPQVKLSLLCRGRAQKSTELDERYVADQVLTKHIADREVTFPGHAGLTPGATRTNAIWILQIQAGPRIWRGVSGAITIESTSPSAQV
jgi:hypothetical protein